jgi:ketosteroid isomerase-like protein
MAEVDPFDDVEAFYGPYRKAFHSGDMAAIEALFEYPYVLSNPEGVREIHDSSFYKALFDKLKGGGWIGSRFDRFRKLRMGKDGAIVMVDYSRLREDGSVMNSGSAAYVLRHRPDGWKLVGILDGFGGPAAGTETK